VPSTAPVPAAQPGASMTEEPSHITSALESIHTVSPSPVASNMTFNRFNSAIRGIHTTDGVVTELLEIDILRFLFDNQDLFSIQATGRPPRYSETPTLVSKLKDLAFEPACRYAVLKKVVGETYAELSTKHWLYRKVNNLKQKVKKTNVPVEVVIDKMLKERAIEIKYPDLYTKWKLEQDLERVQSDSPPPGSPNPFL